ncbi:MAG: hypothetical protein FD123_4321 [Bacteroidetes bacterium]|nr:MAG: hypothetical protein FD123_4321 [Bacteroidota bacterium]
MIKRITLPALFLIGSIVMLNGCKKETQDTETTSATDNTICEAEFTRVLPTVNNFGISEPGVQRIEPGAVNVQWNAGCATITIDTAQAFPVLMTVDYGTVGCTDSIDGKTRKGKILIDFSAPFYTNGATMTATFQDYYVNGIKFEGTTTITRTGQYTFTQSTANGKCTGSTNNWTILWECTRNYTWTQGSGTPTVADDIVEVSGSGAGTDRNGLDFTVNITSPLIKSMGCRWIQQGTVELTPNGKPTRTVDFGTVGCDDKATITIDGNTFEFTMN